MIEKYVNKITKEEIALLPIEEFKGRIITLLTEKDADKAVDYLSQFPMIGFERTALQSIAGPIIYRRHVLPVPAELYGISRITRTSVGQCQYT